MKQSIALYQLQQTDSRIDTIRKRLEEISQQLRENAAVQKAEAGLETAQQQFQHWQATQKDAELERDQLKSEAVESNERLYSGNVTNPRELEDLQGKIAEQKKRIDNLDTEILEAMMEKEQAQETLKAAQMQMEAVLAEQSDTLGSLNKERQELQTELERLIPERDELRNEVDASHLSTYDSLRFGKNKVAVAAVINNDTCGVCGVEMNMREIKDVRRGEILQCETCNRIFYWVS